MYKRKKNTRQRGNTTHGYGSMKKNRGAGNKGGKGMAGSGKRSDQLKPSLWKNKNYFGKHGFKKKGTKRDICPINIFTLEENIEKFVAEKKVTKEGDTYIIDLNKIGYNKLLAQGKASKKFKITADHASKNAVERVKEAGGEVILKEQ